MNPIGAEVTINIANNLRRDGNDVMRGRVKHRDREPSRTKHVDDLLDKATKGAGRVRSTITARHRFDGDGGLVGRVRKLRFRGDVHGEVLVVFESIHAVPARTEQKRVGLRGRVVHVVEMGIALDPAAVSETVRFVAVSVERAHGVRAQIGHEDFDGLVFLLVGVFAVSRGEEDLAVGVGFVGDDAVQLGALGDQIVAEDVLRGSGEVEVPVIAVDLAHDVG